MDSSHTRTLLLSSSSSSVSCCCRGPRSLPRILIPASRSLALPKDIPPPSSPRPTAAAPSPPLSIALPILNSHRGMLNSSPPSSSSSSLPAPIAMRVVLPADSESLSEPPQALAQALSDSFLANIINTRPEFCSTGPAGARGNAAAAAASGGGGAFGASHASDSDCLSTTAPATPHPTPPMKIPLLGEGSYSCRQSSHTSLVSPSASYHSLQHYSSSDASLSRSHDIPRSLNITRHARSMSFNNSDDDDDDNLHWRGGGFRNSPPSLPLVPYKNQVGGHAAFLRFSDKALCKPLNAKERDFYEAVESMHPEIKSFIATYLGVVNVTYSTLPEDADTFGVAEGTPVVILEENKHILFDDFEDLDHSGNGSTDSVSQRYSRKLQQQVFKDALSPQSLRARFAQLRSAVGAMQRRHSFGSTSAERPCADDFADPCHTTPTKIKSPLSSDCTMQQDASAPSKPAVDDTQRMDSVHDPDPSSCAAGTDPLTPIFQMSEDEEDRAPDARPKRIHASPPRTTHLHPRLIRSPSTPVRPSALPPIDDPALPSTPAPSAPNRTNTAPTPSSVNYNPWSLHLYNNTMSKISKGDKGKRRTDQFLLLEDLTEGFHFPCILDLKMGSRQHGVYATAEKRISQEKKCEKSTSKKLGVRICGMQVYKQNTGTFTYLDKYVGRQINAANFKQSLLSFLDNGEKYLIGYIPKMLDKLRKLYKVVSKMPTYRFYASSLLILYDGAWATEEPESASRLGSSLSVTLTGEDGEPINFDPSSPTSPTPGPRDVDMKMIDFANCVSNAQLLRRMDDSAAGETDELLSATAANIGSPPPEATMEAAQRTVRVPFPPTTRGPDNGYLLGLRTLIHSFEELYRELGPEAPPSSSTVSASVDSGATTTVTTTTSARGSFDAQGHVYKNTLSATQRVHIGTRVTGLADILSPEPILFAGGTQSTTASSFSAQSAPAAYPATTATATDSSAVGAPPAGPSASSASSTSSVASSLSKHMRRPSGYVLVRRDTVSQAPGNSSSSSRSSSFSKTHVGAVDNKHHTSDSGADDASSPSIHSGDHETMESRPTIDIPLPQFRNLAAPQQQPRVVKRASVATPPSSL